MTARELLFFRGWELHPSVVAGCVLFLAAYLVWVRPRTARHTVLFTLGTAVLFVALTSPLDPLGDDYLFSAHMLQHLLLCFAAPPLWLLGLPSGWTSRVLARPAVRRAEGPWAARRSRGPWGSARCGSGTCPFSTTSPWPARRSTSAST